jgi:hypothetical protein
MHALHSLAYRGGIVGLQMVGHVHPPDNENPAIVLHFTVDIATKAAIISIDFARIQRAGKRAEHSTAQSRNHVVNSGGVRLGQATFVNAVVFGNTPVDAEHHGLWFSWQVRSSQRALNALDAYVGSVGDCSH